MAARSGDRNQRGLTRRSSNSESQVPGPGVITRVVATQRDPERVSVFIDGAFAFALPALVAVQRGLQRGVELTAEAVEELSGIAEAEKATEAALSFVSYRPRSEREVRDRLRRREFTPEAIDYAVEKLRGWRYLDDRAFAEFWVENRIEHAPRGRRSLQSELRAKGVDREIAGEVIDESGLDEAGDALEIARKRMRSLAGLDEPTQRRRLAAFLARRGYGWDVVKPALDRLIGSEEEEDSGDDDAASSC